MAFGMYPQYFPQQTYTPQQQYPYYSPPMPDQLAQLRAGMQSPAQQMPQQEQAQNSSGVIWVQGEAGAKSYLVANGANVLLMDSESNTFYLKSADASGMPSMRIFDYTERVNTKNSPPVTQTNVKQFATKEELESIAKRLEMLENKKKRGVTADESNGQ